jgi:hypothetical protein
MLHASPRVRCAPDAKRGFDHGVFVPLQVAFPAADVPTTQLSLLRGLSTPAHVALRDEGVLIIASGMTFHDLAAMRAAIAGKAGAADVAPQSEAFDAWLTDTLTAADVAPDERLNRLEHWADAPHGAPGASMQDNSSTDFCLRSACVPSAGGAPHAAAGGCRRGAGRRGGAAVQRGAWLRCARLILRMAMMRGNHDTDEHIQHRAGQWYPP